MWCVIFLERSIGVSSMILTSFKERKLIYVQVAVHIPGHALGIWICGCSLFYKKELWASKSAGAHSTKSLKISGCKRWCLKDLRVCAPAAPMLTHSLNVLTKINSETSNHIYWSGQSAFWEDYERREFSYTFLNLDFCKTMPWRFKLYSFEIGRWILLARYQ